MDFRNFNNPTTGNSPNIDTKVKTFSGLSGDITTYLSDPDKLEELATAANKAHEMGEFTAPFLDNVTKYLEGLTKVVDGQTKFTQLRKKFGGKVSEAIAKLRGLEREFTTDLEVVEAKDKAHAAKLQQRRQETLKEIAVNLQQDLQLQAWKHQNNLATAQRKLQTSQERQRIQADLAEKRRALMERVRYGK